MTDHTALPDHPIRKHVLWQMFDRLWRPATGWAVFAGTVYAGLVGPLIERPMAEGYLVAWLTFAAAVLGIKSFEKVRGVA
jgi:RsiW-degrading membrane proteinase PrsW (M82 family)